MAQTSVFIRHGPGVRIVPALLCFPAWKLNVGPLTAQDSVSRILLFDCELRGPLHAHPWLGVPRQTRALLTSAREV